MVMKYEVIVSNEAATDILEIVTPLCRFLQNL
jgi:hypothetical protein